MHHARSEQRLLYDVHTSREAYRAALEQLRHSTDLCADLGAHPDGTLHLQVATRKFGQAAESYRKALKALSDHVLSQPL